MADTVKNLAIPSFLKNFLTRYLIYLLENLILLSTWIITVFFLLSFLSVADTFIGLLSPLSFPLAPSLLDSLNFNPFT